MKSHAQIYNWIYNYGIYEPPLLLLKGRDVRCQLVSNIVLIALKSIEINISY